MKYIIPTMLTVLFFLESVFSLFSPISFNDALLTLVPRFVFVCLIFLGVYGNRKMTIIYGIIFGLLYDIFYIDIIGVYAFLYPVISIIAVGIIRYVHKNMLIVIAITFILIALLEILSYGFVSFVSITSISFDEFLRHRLIPTMLANSVFIIMFSWFFKMFMINQVLEKLENY